MEVNSSRIAHLLRILSANVDQAPNPGKTVDTSLELVSLGVAPIPGIWCLSMGSMYAGPLESRTMIMV